MLRDLFEQIRSVAPSAIYLHSRAECIPCPPNTNTASLSFVQDGDYSVGLTQAPTTQEHDNIILLLRYGALVLTASQQRLVAAKTAIINHPWAEWTQQQLLDWWTPRMAPAVINALSIPQGAKDVLNAQATAILSEGQFIIFVRDLFLSGLPEGQVNVQGSSKATG